MTLNWAMQVSLDPKYLAVSVEQSAVTHGLILEGAASRSRLSRVKTGRSCAAS